MSIHKAHDFKAQFETWWQASPKKVVTDNRRRYRMLLEDQEERDERGLSSIPSTKSCSVVDNFAIDAVMEYFAEPDNLSYTARDISSSDLDMKARWLTEIFRYRAEHTFPFQSWLMQALKIVAVDGLLGVSVSWRKESYKKKKQSFWMIDDNGMRVEIPEQLYTDGVVLAPNRFGKEDYEEEITVKDTWWLDMLKPGESIFWDFKNPTINLNDGTMCLVITQLTEDEVDNYVEMGVFKKVEDIGRYQKVQANQYTDLTAVAQDPDTVDLGEDGNRIPLWIWFEKDDAQWHCTFLLNGELIVKEKAKVDDVFFAGRQVNKLPVALGCIDYELWEAIGRGLPKLIGPLEDELINHKNNIADIAKLTVQGRWRVTPGSDIDIDELLNSRIIQGVPGEFERIPDNFGAIETFRAADTLLNDIAELVPVGMSSRQFVPKGTNKTLGAVQLAAGDEKKQLNARLLVFNETFMKPLMYLIAQNIFSFETDELLLRIAGNNVKTGQVDEQGNPVPYNIPQDGQNVDLSQLDFDVEVQINAGLGSIPRERKFQKMMQIIDLGNQLGIPQDNQKVYEQACVLAGFSPDQFKSKQAPPQKPPELSGTVNIDFGMLEPSIQQALIMQFLGNGNKVKMNMKDSPVNEKEQDRILQEIVNTPDNTSAGEYVQ